MEAAEKAWYERWKKISTERELQRAASALLAALEGLLEVVLPCNPQDPSLEASEECPVDHTNCCGRCARVHAARAAIAKAEGR